MIVAMTFIPKIGETVGPILIAFAAAGLLALVLTPIVRRIVLRYKMIDRPEARRVNTSPIPRGGGIAVATTFILVVLAFLAINTETIRLFSPLQASQLAALLLGGALAAAIGAADDMLDLRARWQLAGQLGLGLFAVLLGINIGFIANPLGGPVIRFEGPFAIGFTIFWIVGMINSINFIDGLDGLSSGIAFIAAVTLGIISLTSGVNQPLVAILCFILAGALLGFLRWNLHPGVDLPRHERRPVRRLHAGAARDPRHGEGRGRYARARACRSSTRSGSSSDACRNAVPRSAPTGATSTIGCWTWASRTGRRCSPSTASASCSALLALALSGVTQLYAFVGVFLAFGLVLFIPTRGAFRRPEELEAESYTNHAAGASDGATREERRSG